MIPRKKNGRSFYCLHLQTTIRKYCFLDCVLLPSSLYHHCSFTGCKRKAARKKDSSKADPVLAQLQKHSKRSPFHVLYLVSTLETISVIFCHHSDSVTLLQHLQLSSSCLLWVFSGKKQILPFRKHLLSLHIIFLLPDLSNELFQELPGEWEQVGNHILAS